ncbi:MAG TPA: S8 family serine peptidase [Tepidisphaeraceae bacterium]|jgi:subtilisin family serine protease
MPKLSARKVAARKVLVEALEARQLMAADWGPSAELIHQDLSTTNFPSITGKGVTIAFCDTGVDYSHPALGGGFGAGHKVKAGWDFVDNDADPFDTYGHGTNTAGIAAATGFDYQGQHYSGIAPDAEIVELRIAKDGSTIQDQTLEQALQWIIQNYKTYNISIANVSFGGGNYTSSYTNPTLSDEFQKLHDLGILVISSSGNAGVNSFGGTGIAYPAADANVAAVGGLNAEGQIDTVTQRGPLLDLLAPGVNVPTTTKFSGYGAASGTSFAAPFVTGAAALLKQVNPNFQAADLFSILRASGGLLTESNTSLGTTIKNNYSTLDLNRAIALAQTRSTTADASFGKNAIVNDVAYDRDGVLHMAYYDAGTKTLKYATRVTNGQWSAVQTVDKKGDVGAFLSIAVDPTGKPSIAYYDATNADLKYAHFDGSKWGAQKLETSKNTGLYPSLMFEKDGTARIAYYRRTAGDLRLMTFDGNGWTRSNIDTSGDVGRYASIARDNLGKLGVAYADVKNGLKFASFDGSAWSPQFVDKLAGVTDISLAYDVTNEPSISYFSATVADLRFASHPGAWKVETVARKGVQGQYSSLYYDENHDANIIYYNASTNRLMKASGGSGAWTATSLVSKGGAFSSADVSEDGTKAGFTYWATSKKKLAAGETT